MTTYGDVRTKFISRMNRRDLDTTTADGFLQDAITRIQRIMRVPAMEKSLFINIDGNYTVNGGLLIPSDYLQLRQITYNDKSELQKQDVSIVLPIAQDTGEPRVFCRRGGVWVLGPTPEGPTTDPVTHVITYNIVRVDYYGEFASMTLPADSTILTSIASDLLVYGALAYACDHWSDKRGDKFEQRFTQILSDIEAMGDDDETAGGASVQPAYFFSDDLDGTN